MASINLTTSTFDETVGASNVPVVVDFWAEWCGPCKMVAPILDEIATENADQMTIAKLNVDEKPQYRHAVSGDEYPNNDRVQWRRGRSPNCRSEEQIRLSSRSSEHFWATPTNPRRGAAKPSGISNGDLFDRHIRFEATESGWFGDSTKEAVTSFQASQGIPPTGSCDELTWSLLVESGWALGDRLLMLTAPNLRGEDVAEHNEFSPV